MLTPPYSEDEVVVLAASLALSVATWIHWYLQLRVGPRLRRERAPSRALAIMPLVALGVLWLILKRWSSFDVRDSAAYLFQYMALGAAWLGFALLFLPRFGISARDDAAERGNPAAAVALSGALLGLCLCYAGGNVGDGPGWWVVVFSSGLSTLCLFASWAVLEWAAHPSDAITIDRDVAAGTRHAAFSIAQGLVLARGVAGDWESAPATLRDLASNGWPALVLLAVAILFERALSPTGDAPRRSLVACGLLPGAVLLAAASTWVVAFGVGA
ncbi:MAG: hypothetical protein HOP15_04295 [Planctomycetes bacterium]|nr:hypothetical protein [Planctomycetota bacterium]